MSRPKRQPGVSPLRRIGAWPLGAVRGIGRGFKAVGAALWRAGRAVGRGVSWVFAPPLRLARRLMAPVARPVVRWVWPVLRPCVLWPWRLARIVVGAPIGAVVRIFRPAPKVLGPYRADPRSLSRRVRRTSLILFLTFFCFIYGAAFALMGQGLIILFAVPPALLTLAVIWALPDMPNPPTRALSWFFMAFFITMVLWPNYLALSLPGLPWITTQRLTSFPMVGLFLISLSVSRRFRGELGSILAATPVVWRLLVVWVMLQRLSVGFSVQPSFSLQKYIVAQINWTCMYLVGCWVFMKKGRLTFWVRAMWVLAMYVSVIALIEQKEGHVPWAGHIPSFLAIEDPSIQRVLIGSTRSALGVHRVSTTFTSPLGLGEYIALTMPFALHFIATTKDWRLRLAALVSVPVFFLDVFMADSRLGLIGCLMSVILSIFGQAYFRWRNNKQDLLAPGIVLSYPVIAAAAIAVVLGIGKFRRKVLGSGAEQASNDSRAEQWRMGIPKIWKRPWGYGISQAGETLGYIAPGQDFLTIDSYYLALLLDYGPLGFVLYWALILGGAAYAAVWGVLHRSTDEEHGLLVPIAISILNFFVIKSVFILDDNHPIVFMMLGAVTALIYRAKTAAAQAHKPAAVGAAEPWRPRSLAAADARG